MELWWTEFNLNRFFYRTPAINHLNHTFSIARYVPWAARFLSQSTLRADKERLLKHSAPRNRRSMRTTFIKPTSSLEIIYGRVLHSTSNAFFAHATIAALTFKTFCLNNFFHRQKIVLACGHRISFNRRFSFAKWIFANGIAWIRNQRKSEASIGFEFNQIWGERKDSNLKFKCTAPSPWLSWIGELRKRRGNICFHLSLFHRHSGCRSHVPAENGKL